MTSGVHDGAPTQLQTISQQQFAHFGKDGFTEFVRLQQAAKVQQGSGIRHALAAQVYAAEITECFDVVQRVFASLIGQVEPVGNAVHA